MEILSGTYQNRLDSQATLGLSRRAYAKRTTSEALHLHWEAGPYYERVAELLEQARSYAIFVGWQIDSRIELSTRRHEGFRDFVLRLCREKPDFHVYFLMWDYAYFYVFERELLQGWIWDKVHERVHFVFDNRHPYGGSHHEKLVVVDGEVAFVGGVDICDDRWDTPQHLFEDNRRSLRHDRDLHQPYHDVIAEVNGEAAADLVEHVGGRWRALSSVPFPSRPRLARGEGGGRHQLLISRTRARVGTERPLLIRETEFLFRELIQKAERQVVIEQQYYWSYSFNDALVRLMHRRAGSGLKIFLAVPAPIGGSLAFRMMGVVQTQLVDELVREARKTGTLFVLGCPFSKGRTGEKRVYVHSKVLVVDDQYFVVGSSNLNNRGFRFDTELNLTLLAASERERRELVALTRRLIGHWGAEAYSAFYGSSAGPELVNGNVYLKNYHEAWDGYFTTFEGRVAQRIPLQKIFDPPVPLLYALKARLAVPNALRIRRALPLAILGVIGLCSGISLIFASTAVRLSGAGFWWGVTLSTSLAMSWLLPVPTVLTSAYAGALLGAKAACVIVACSLLVSAVAGYVLARVFPNIAQRFCEKLAPAWLPQSLGLRRLPVLLYVVCNPFLNFQSKIAYQGIFSMPVRWFAAAAMVMVAVNALVAKLFAGFSVPPGGGSAIFASYIIIALVVTIQRLMR